MENEASHFGALPVAQAMSKRPTCIPATGLKLNQLEKILRDNNFKGFPVIKRIRDHRLEGFISRESILKVLDEASKQGATSSTSHCFFGASDSGPVVSSTSIDFGSQLDQNPFIIHPKLALETVQSIFRNIGPRVLLVELQGNLVGLITKKDVLNYERFLENNTLAPENSVYSPARTASWWTNLTGFFSGSSVYRRLNNYPDPDHQDGVPLTGL
ncbi:glycerol ethanol, ferric requiring protein [Entomophthora muscae]|nr:glycerol ethanol, ferric requiring protein [Entomophthora muscae]